MNIRATHHYGFRSGEWAEIVGVEWDSIRSRPIFRVRFIDGTMDTWPVYDPSDPYEFRLFGPTGIRRAAATVATPSPDVSA